ncbi:hypothetical protein VHEMI09242 [[Torrubiella] hemipterigena]|uniref:Uncharacterized protein n=1 Tax=[Torrubiella] hemipterigena TaxID=1531966 RepID=A0A0A1T9E7_9HYPO|nr:hypothetical protein VHEMI09242 [[Torrubiella] hemipterigena]
MSAFDARNLVAQGIQPMVWEDKLMVVYNLCKSPLHIMRIGSKIEKLPTIPAEKSDVKHQLINDPGSSAIEYRFSLSEKNLHYGAGTVQLLYNLNYTDNSLAIESQSNTMFRSPFPGGQDYTHNVAISLD